MEYHVLTQNIGLRLLAMKSTPIEKFQYLVHLRASNPHLFYRLLGENIKVNRNSLITPTEFVN